MLPFDFVVDVVVAAADVVDAHFELLMFLLSINDTMISAIVNNFAFGETCSGLVARRATNTYLGLSFSKRAAALCDTGSNKFFVVSCTFIF